MGGALLWLLRHSRGKVEFCPYGQESLAEEGHLRRELSEMKHQALGYTWLKGMQRKKSACAKVLRCKMLECPRNSKEQGAKGGRGRGLLKV